VINEARRYILLYFYFILILFVFSRCFWIQVFETLFYMYILTDELCRMFWAPHQVKARVVSCFLTWVCWISATTNCEIYLTTFMSLTTSLF
jgi:hypothetical protein